MLQELYDELPSAVGKLLAAEASALESEISDLRAQLVRAQQVADAEAKEIRAMLATMAATTAELKNKNRLIAALSDIHGLNVGVVEFKVRRGRVRLVVATSPKLDEHEVGKACAEMLADALKIAGAKWEKAEP